ncbi:hypothetical protein M673_07480 [Aureimonas sp. AU20]|nr:hypothetical protein M673_07480 [Aureimonas sp. AU20]
MLIRVDMSADESANRPGEFVPGWTLAAAPPRLTLFAIVKARLAEPEP